MRPIFSAIEWLVHRDRSGPTMGSDIMYVPAWDRLLFLFLCIVLDVWSRTIVGWP